MDESIKLSDYTALPPLKIFKSGSDFKYRIIEIVTSTSRKYYHVDDIINDAERLIDWINDIPKFTESQNKKQ